MPEGASITPGRWARRRAAAALFLGALAGARPAHAQPAAPLRIHVRGSAQIDAVAWSEADGFVLRGTLVDDAGAPVPRAALSIQPVAGGAPRTPVPPAVRCATSPGLGGVIPTTPDGWAVDTDERGGFCLRGQEAIGKASLRVRFQGTKLHEGAEALVALEDQQAALSPVALRFDPPVDAIDLDRESFAVTTALRIDRSDPRRDRAGAGAAFQREGLPLVLEDERGAKLAEALTGGDGRARFEVKTAALDGPGQGELRARFEGSTTLARTSASQPVLRRALVALSLSRPVEAGSPDDGIPIEIDVASARGPVDGGVVEALRAGESVGAGAVLQGKARVVAAFASERAGRVPLTMRYVPAAPWFRPGADLAVEVPVAGPGIWRQVLLGALVVAIAGWVIGSWRRAPKPAVQAEAEPKPAPPSGRAGVHIVGPAEGAGGWRGAVTDAHDGTPIAGAELTIVAPSFEGTGVIARAVTDGAGAFRIEAGYRGDARLVVKSAAHSTYEQVLPPPSVLGVALVTRRRALLDRLVRWARRQGPPFEGPPEPTPGHVRRVATRAQHREIEGWASKLEQAAFGPEVVDERVEQEVRSGEPRPGPRG